MASSIKHPLRPSCFIKINLIALVLCLSAATCHSEDLSSETLNGIGDLQISNPYSVRLPTAKKEDSGCDTACTEGEGKETTVRKPELEKQSSESSRPARSLLEDIEKNGHQRESRAGALNKNFLRFGRGSLNKNFLRFGRGGNLKQNFLRFGRGGLQKNFLRFGRKEYDFNSGEKLNSGLVENLPNDESTDLHSFGNADNLMRAIERLQSEMAENQANDMHEQETDDSLGEMDANGSTAGGPGAFEMEENGAKVKRGSLSNNFLRFGRNYNSRQSMFSGKRGSLNRNFLRFGKRSAGPPNAAVAQPLEETGNKVKRDVGLDKAVDEKKATKKLPQSPWLNKTLSSQAEMPRSVHEVSIRRRSLNENLSSGNFLRFGRL